MTKDEIARILGAERSIPEGCPPMPVVDGVVFEPVFVRTDGQLVFDRWSGIDLRPVE